MNLKKLHGLLERGVSVQITFSILDETRMVAAVNVSKFLPDAKEPNKITTRPLLLKGLPEEIEAELVDQLIKREPEILKTFFIDDSAFNKSLEEIKEDANPSKSTKKPAKPEPKPKKEAKTPTSPMDIAIQFVEDIKDGIDTATSEKELRVLWDQLKNYKPADKFCSAQKEETLRLIQAAILNMDENPEITNEQKVNSEPVVEEENEELKEEPVEDDPEIDDELPLGETDELLDQINDSSELEPNKTDLKDEEEQNPWQ